MLHIPGLFITNSEGRDRGVFTAQDLQKGDLIEVCPVLIFPKNEIKLLNKTIIYEYYFLWPDGKGSACMALGYGSIYNHSVKPNASTTLDVPNRSMEIVCERDIIAGEEIFIDYTGGHKNKTELWFEVV